VNRLCTQATRAAAVVEALKTRNLQLARKVMA
jgi:hypothetical protein